MLKEHGQNPHYICEQREINHFPAVDDEVWKQLSSLSLCDVVTGGEPRLSTTVELFWNQERAALYMRFTCLDDHIVSTMTDHDASIYEEDVVEAFISETGNKQCYKEFEVSPTNVKFDAIIYNEPTEPEIRVEREWHAKDWRTETEVSQGQYISIWELPFHNFIGGIPSPGDVWSLNCYRIDRGRNQLDEFTAWSTVGTMQFHTPDKFGYLQFR